MVRWRSRAHIPPEALASELESLIEENLICENNIVNLHSLINNSALIDSHLKQIVEKAKAYRREEHYEEAIEQMCDALKYFESAYKEKDNFSRVDFLITKAILQQELSIWYKLSGDYENAIKLISVNIAVFQELGSKVEDETAVESSIANEYLTLLSLKKKIGQDRSHDVRQAEQYLWRLFQKRSIDDKHVKDLFFCFYLIYKIFPFDNIQELISLKEREKELIEYCIEENVSLPSMKPKQWLGINKRDMKKLKESVVL